MVYVRRLGGTSFLIACCLIGGMTVGAFGLEPVVVPHSVYRDVPGKIQLVSWGWLGSVYYQVVPYTGYSPAEYKQRVIDEPHKWGANLLEFYPPYFHTPGQLPYPMPWPEGLEEFPRPATYHHYDDPRWTKEAIIDLTRYCHDHGYMVQWFMHPKPCLRGTFEENLLAWRFLARQYSDVLTMPARDMIDGMGWEAWWLDNEGRTTWQQWVSNPGMFSNSTATWPEEFAPNYSYTHMCANPGRPMGRDDQWGMETSQSYPLGSVPLTYQADARPLRLTHESWKYWSKFSQGTWPDWILKQTEDFFRRQVRAGDKPDAHSIWWLGEPESTLPEELRRYVYLSCLDPLRHAATTRLWTTGLGGYSDRLHDAMRKPLFHRYEHPWDTAYIGNNHLRVYRHAGGDHGALELDPGRTGEYDADGMAVTVSDDFLRTVVEQPYEPEPEVILSSQSPPSPKLPDVDAREYASDPLAAGEYASADWVWKIGAFDRSSDELQPETPTNEPATYTIGQPANEFPAVMTSPNRGPGTIHIEFETQANAVTLLIGQQKTHDDESVEVSINGTPQGSFVTRRGGAAGYWLHSFGPFALPADSNEHTLTLQWDGYGGGFQFDALAMVEAKDAVGVEPFDPAPDEVVMDWVSGATVPGGLSNNVRYPGYLKLNVELEPGRYDLVFKGLTAKAPSPLTVEIDGTYGPGFGLRPGQEVDEKRLGFTITEAGQHTIEFIDVEGFNFGWDELQLVRTSPIVIQHEFPEPGGYIAHMTERISDPRFDESRYYRSIGDFAGLRVEIERRLREAGTSRTELDLKSGHVRLNGRAIQAGRTVLPEHTSYLVFTQPAGEPKFGLTIESYAKGTAIDFVPNESFAIVSPETQAGELLRFRMRLGLIDDVYTADQLDAVMRFTLELENGQSMPATEHNPLDVPVIKITQTYWPKEGPYMACEQGADGIRRWIMRGAQPSKEHDILDFIRVYLPPKGTALVDNSGWMEDVLQPAPGNQHIVACSDIRGDERQASATVRVMQVAPHVFSPSVRFKKPIAAAWVDGGEWAYFEGDTLHLPAEVGDYRAKVRFDGEPGPHLLRTCALVRKATVEDGRLHIEALLPPWSTDMPGELPFTFGIDGCGREIAEGDGYSIVRSHADRAIISADPGTIVVSFNE
jgi:hypothetical protein